MVIRVKTIVERKDRKIQGPALANSGFGTEAPTILLPDKEAEKIGLWPLKDWGTKETAKTAGGPSEIIIYPQAGKVKVVSRGTESNEVRCDIVVSEAESEALLSDILIDKVRIQFISLGEGLWRFKSDPPNCTRESVKKGEWKNLINDP